MKLPKPWPGFPEEPPPGPARPSFWISPLRGPWLTAFLGSLMLPFLLLVGLTGFLSHAAYDPDVGANAILPRGDDIQFLIFDWPTKPSWLYALNQGTHTIVGICLVPLVLAKLWSVIPKLFQFPPAVSPAQALERLSILGLVGGIIFELVTGILNIQLDYVFKFDFVRAHYYGAIVFLVSLALHVGVKLPTIRRAYRERGVLKPLMDDLQHTRPEPYAVGSLAPPEPAQPTISRRGLMGLVGATSAALFVAQAGQSIGGPFRRLSLFAPRGGGTQASGTSFPVNKTAHIAKITPDMVSEANYALTIAADGRERTLPRAALLRLRQEEHRLPIACVEGWSTTQHWEGVPLRDLATMAGKPDAHLVHVVSLQKGGAFKQTTLTRDQLHAHGALLALKVGGHDLPLDHGYPARIIVPALPGVHNTKWVQRLEFS